MKTTKIKVIKAGYFAGAYHEAGSKIELTERQLECVKRRNREFEILEGPDKGKVISGGESEKIEGGEGDKGPKVTVKDLKAALDDKGVDYPANAKKDDLQALLDQASDNEAGSGEKTEGGEDLM